jgi:hypothetical protein
VGKKHHSSTKSPLPKNWRKDVGGIAASNASSPTTKRKSTRNKNSTDGAPVYVEVLTEEHGVIEVAETAIGTRPPVFIAAPSISTHWEERTKVLPPGATGAPEHADDEVCWQCGGNLCDWIEYSAELLAIVDEKFPMNGEGVRVGILTNEEVAPAKNQFVFYRSFMNTRYCKLGQSKE